MVNSPSPDPEAPALVMTRHLKVAVPAAFAVNFRVSSWAAGTVVAVVNALKPSVQTPNSVFVGVISTASSGRPLRLQRFEK